MSLGAGIGTKIAAGAVGLFITVPLAVVGLVYVVTGMDEEAAADTAVFYYKAVGTVGGVLIGSSDEVAPALQDGRDATEESKGAQPADRDN